MTELSRRDFARCGVAGLTALAFPRAVAAQTGARVYRYIHLDVFTTRPTEGNQLFVFTQPTGLDTETMQKITRESNLSECTFVFPPEQQGTDHRVRIFTRTAETPFAGHPTIGTAFALARTGVLKPGTARTTFGLGVGPIALDLDWKDGRLAFAWMTQLKPTFGKAITDVVSLAAALGLDAAALRLNLDTAAAAAVGPRTGTATGTVEMRLRSDASAQVPAIPANGSVRLQPEVASASGVPLQTEPLPAGQEVNCGSNFFIVPLATRKAVDAAVLDRAKVDALFTTAGIARRGIYVFSVEPNGDDVTAYSRMLPSGGIEDPATGSAVGPAGCFAARYRLVPRARIGAMTFLQGVLAHRPSRLHVNVAMSGTEVATVQVGGASVVVGEGTMEV